MINESKYIIDSPELQKPTLVHGDMAPNNLYIFDSGEVELLDLEWIGVCQNKALAMVLDFGNLRARSWTNEKFRMALDDELLKIYKERNQEELGKAVIRMSILRSHLMLSGFFENYDWDKQKTAEQTLRRETTEKDILKAFK